MEQCEFWRRVMEDPRIIISNEKNEMFEQFVQFLGTLHSVSTYAHLIPHSKFQFLFSSRIVIDEETYFAITQQFLNIVQASTVSVSVDSNFFNDSYILDAFDIFDLHEVGGVSERDIFLLLLLITATNYNQARSFFNEFGPILFDVFHEKAKSHARERELIPTIPLSLCRKLAFLFNIEDYLVTRCIGELEWSNRLKLTQQEFHTLFMNLLLRKVPQGISTIHTHDISAKTLDSPLVIDVYSTISHLQSHESCATTMITEEQMSARSIKTPRNLDSDIADIGSEQSAGTVIQQESTGTHRFDPSIAKTSTTVPFTGLNATHTQGKTDTKETNKIAPSSHKYMETPFSDSDSKQNCCQVM